MEDKNFSSIFKGSAVEADTIHDYLEQQGIGSLVRNHMQENLNAGWMTADSEHAAEVFVARENATEAKNISDSLFNEKGEFVGARATAAKAVEANAPSSSLNNLNKTPDKGEYSRPVPSVDTNRQPLGHPETGKLGSERTDSVVTPPNPPRYEI